MYNLLSKWMLLIKQHPEYTETFTNCFWPSQLKSKKFIIDQLNLQDDNLDVYIFGGWYGVFAQLLYEHTPANYYNIDIDPECETVFNLINDNQRIVHLTADMADFDYPSKPDVVINTSSEHVPQNVYDEWWNKIPTGTKYVVQGNNFTDWHEHVRCAESLDEFLHMNHLTNSLKSFEIDCGQRPNMEPFIRFMAIGIK